MPISALRVSLVSVSCIAVLLAGCGSEKKDKVATQVAAKVNKEEISVHQINNVLSRAGNLPPDQAKLAAREVLDKLIEQELLVAKAMDKKLDREPRIMQTLEASRKQILAQAYMEQLLASMSKPTADEIKAYFGKHPELFSERRLYRFQEVNVAAGGARLPSLQQNFATAKSLSDILAILKEKNIAYTVNATTKAAEQLPMELAPRFSQMKDGQIAVIPSERNILVVQLIESRSAPIELAAATPVIEQFLINQKRNELAAKELKQLRADAKIEYVGDFAKDITVLATEAKAAEVAKAKADADAVAKAKDEAVARAAALAEADAKARNDLKAKIESQSKADAERKAASPAESKSAAPAIAKESISKGLSGLR